MKLELGVVLGKDVFELANEEEALEAIVLPMTYRKELFNWSEEGNGSKENLVLISPLLDRT